MMLNLITFIDMELKDLIGKTITSAMFMQRTDGYDDKGYLKLVFADGSECVIVGGYDENWTGQSMDEYPTTIGITSGEHLMLVPESDD